MVADTELALAGPWEGLKSVGASSIVVGIVCSLPSVEIGLTDLPKLGGGALLAPTELALKETVNFTLDSSSQFKTLKLISLTKLAVTVLWLLTQ